jgi:hypothetical protein
MSRRSEGGATFDVIQSQHRPAAEEPGQPPLVAARPVENDKSKQKVWSTRALLELTQQQRIAMVEDVDRTKNVQASMSSPNLYPDRALAAALETLSRRLHRLVQEMSARK